jgi:hypothetical protein
VLSGTTDGAVPAAAVSEGTFFGGMAAAGMAGGALGAAAPRASAAGVKGRGASVNDRKRLKDGDSPQNLQRIVADMAEKPESVQHWHTDPEHLDELLAELRLKPGTHAVHVKNGKPQTKTPTSQPI